MAGQTVGSVERSFMRRCNTLTSDAHLPLFLHMCLCIRVVFIEHVCVKWTPLSSPPDCPCSNYVERHNSIVTLREVQQVTITVG